MRRIALILACGMAAAPVSQALASTLVVVDARWGTSNDVHADSDDEPSLSGAPVVSGVARDDSGGGSASVSDQPLSTCGLACDFASDGQGGAIARAEANGTHGVLRARSFASSGSVFASQGGGSYAEALARIEDVLTFTSTDAGFHFDIGYNWSVDNIADTALGFRFGLLGDANCNPEDPFCRPSQTLAEFAISAGRGEESPFDADYFFSRDGSVEQEGDFIPLSFSFSYDMESRLTAMQTFGIPLTLPFFFELVSESSAAEAQSSAQMVADQSVHIAVTNAMSANNYGYASTVPPAVPEPSTWAMLIMGFFAVGTALRARGAGTRRLETAVR